jgi:hypothetical protein
MSDDADVSKPFQFAGHASATDAGGGFREGDRSKDAQQGFPTQSPTMRLGVATCKVLIVANGRRLTRDDARALAKGAGSGRTNGRKPERR